MTENVPQGVDGEVRGQAHYEKLRRDIRKTIKEKQRIDAELSAIEDKIFTAETQYLEQTTTGGNVVKGFDGYMKGTAASTTNVGGAGTSTRRRPAINEADRIFSKSSTSITRDSEANSTATTPSNAATPVSTKDNNGSANGATAKATNKKKKSRDDDDDDEKKPSKRSKISYARE